MSGKSPVDLHYAKSDNYKKVLQDILDQGVCPFCPGNFDWHPNPILRESGGWLITRSMQPYENSDEHFLLIRQEHAETLDELGPADWLAIGNLSVWAIQEFGLQGGGLTMRWGDPTRTGATVRHIHAHLIIPEINNETGRANYVSFPIG